MDTLEKIEGEIRGQEKVKTDHARLALEYARLKQVYEELLGLLKNRWFNGALVKFDGDLEEWLEN